MKNNIFRVEFFVDSNGHSKKLHEEVINTVNEASQYDVQSYYTLKYKGLSNAVRIVATPVLEVNVENITKPVSHPSLQEVRSIYPSFGRQTKPRLYQLTTKEAITDIELVQFYSIGKEVKELREKTDKLIEKVAKRIRCHPEINEAFIDAKTLGERFWLGTVSPHHTGIEVIITLKGTVEEYISVVLSEDETISDKTN
jgi:hypothetical protein